MEKKKEQGNEIQQEKEEKESYQECVHRRFQFATRKLEMN
jgi:hypothetical protein